MKVLSLLQPWASLVIAGEKKIETRKWFTKHRGELWIHASKSQKEVQQFMNDQYEFMNNGVYRQWMDKQLPFGCIIGRVNLDHIVTTETFFNDPIICPISNVKELSFDEKTWQITDQELAFGDYSPGRFGWLLSDPVAFNVPIPAKGQLMLWNYDIEPRIKAAEELERDGYL